MAKEHWYFLCGMLVVLVPLAMLVAVKKFNLLDTRPDQKINYKVHAGETLTLHAFHPENREGNTPTPALLFFHGGRWLYGGPQEYYPQCEYFAAQGFSCFSAEYNLGANNLPDVQRAVTDARDALAYLREHASELNIDPTRIVAGGSSAGGHLAATLGVALPADAPAPRENRPAALLLYNPMLDLSPGTPDHHLVKDYWESVSPYHHIDAAVSPALLLLGSEDPEVPITTAQAFCDRISEHSGHCQLAIYEGQGHGFFHAPEYEQKTNQRILAFLAELPPR